MKKVYDLLKRVKVEFSCYHVETFLTDLEGDSGTVEQFGLVLYTELVPHPVQIFLRTDEEVLSNLTIESCLQQIWFDIESYSHPELYESNSLLIH